MVMRISNKAAYDEDEIRSKRITLMDNSNRVIEAAAKVLSVSKEILNTLQGTVAEAEPKSVSRSSSPLDLIEHANEDLANTLKVLTQIKEEIG